MGEPHEITEKMWESLKAMPKCKFRLADIPIPKEVIEFKPTPAKQPTVIDELIEKKCCKEDCKENCETPGKKHQNKGGRPKKK